MPSYFCQEDLIYFLLICILLTKAESYANKIQIYQNTRKMILQTSLLYLSDQLTNNNFNFNLENTSNPKIIIQSKQRLIPQVNNMSSRTNTQQNFFSSQMIPQVLLSANNKLNHNDVKLWEPSQLTVNYIVPKIVFCREKRFKLHSIYWPENGLQCIPSTRISKQRSQLDVAAKQISKKIDEQEKNELRIRRRGSSTSHNQKRIRVGYSQNNKKRNELIRTQKKILTLDRKNQEIVKRLLNSPPKKQSRLRDRFGFRSNQVQGQDQHLHSVVQDEMQSMGFSNGFKTSSRRVNLNLPYNYYPGPGSYEIKRYLQDLEEKNMRKIMVAREAPKGKTQ